MAEGVVSSEVITFTHCHKRFKKDRDDYGLLLSIDRYLLGISDTAEGCECLDEYYFDTANVPCDIRCPNCDEDVKIFAQVTASPVWNDDEMLEGRAPRICGFDDVEILRVSKKFKKTTSMKECFKCDIDFENPEVVELHVQDIIGGVVVPNPIILKIIAKAKMSKGLCYLGLEESTDRIFRPIFNTSNKQYCWPTNEQLTLGISYKFNVIAYPNSINFYTPFPHRNEDMIVNEFAFFGAPIHSPMYPSFSHLAKNDIEDIFEDVKKKRYVYEDTQCRSVGILRSSAMITYNKFKKKTYCKIKCKSGVYALPITATECDDIGDTPYTDAVIVLGLARAYKGKEKEYDPARCYLLVVGIYLPKRF